MFRHQLIVVLLNVPALATAAPVVEAIYQRGVVLDGADQLPGFVAPDPLSFVLGDVVRSNGQRDIRVLPNGNFIGAVNTNPQQVGIGAFPSPNSRTAGASYLFGSDDLGNTPRAFLREATIGSEEQLEITGDSGIDFAGNVSYTANLRDPGNPQVSTRSSLWENETPVLIEGDPFTAGPLSGSFFLSAGSVYRSIDGQTSWLSRYSATPGGDAAGTALLRGTSQFNVLLQSGDTIPGLGIVEVGGLANVEWSQRGTNYILEADINSGSASHEAIVVNGAALSTSSGGTVREGLAVPAADGGLPGEVFTGFQFLDVTESGGVAFGAFTSGPDGQDNVILVNGEVSYREGDTVDGVVLSGQPLGVGINDRGDVAFAWSETVFVNDRKIAGVGTLVDSDGDRVPDAPIDGTGIALGGLEITDQLAAGGDGLPVVYFSGEFNGARDAYFRLAPTAALPADYNDDVAVDAADYAAWRDNVGAVAGALPNDVTVGEIGLDHHAAWTTRFGGSGVAAAPGVALVPEPRGLTLFALMAAGLPCVRRVANKRP